MRTPALILLALLGASAPAQAATVGREGTELVYRSAPGQEDFFESEFEEGVLRFEGPEGGKSDITPGAGCTRARRVVHCPLDGLIAVRVLAGDGDDQVAMYGTPIPAAVDLGPGSDDFDGTAPSLTLSAGDGSDRVATSALGGAIDMGPGEDYAQATTSSRFVGPLTIEGGEGRDVLFTDGRRKAGLSLSGGDGPDEIMVESWGNGPGIDVACGPGDDRTRVALVDRPGDGCAAHVAIPAPRTVSRRFSGATLTAPASGSIEFHRDPSPAQRGVVLLARGAFDAPAGPLQTRLKTTVAGRRWIRRDPALKLFVTVKTRSGGDRSEISFRSRLR